MAKGFIAMVYATLKEDGVDTSGMDPKEAIERFKELNKTEKLKQEEIKKHELYHKFKQIKATSSVIGFSVQDTKTYREALKEREDFFAESFKAFNKELNPNEKALLNLSLKFYTKKGADYINPYLRGSTDFFDKEDVALLKTHIRRLDGYISKFEIPKPITVYRSIGFGAIENVDKDNMQSLVGKTITEPGYSSTTLDEDVAAHFIHFGEKEEEKFVFEIKVPKGKNKGIPIWKNSGYEVEQEILLKRNAEFKILSVENKNGRVKLKGEML